VSYHILQKCAWSVFPSIDPSDRGDGWNLSADFQGFSTFVVEEVQFCGVNQCHFVAAVVIGMSRVYTSTSWALY